MNHFFLIFYACFFINKNFTVRYNAKIYTFRTIATRFKYANESRYESNESRYEPGYESNAQ